MNALYILFSKDNYPDIMLPAISKYYWINLNLNLNLNRQLFLLFVLFHSIYGDQYSTIRSNSNCCHIWCISSIISFHFNKLIILSSLIDQSWLLAKESKKEKLLLHVSSVSILMGSFFLLIKSWLIM